jgi:hypothetical protein
MAALRAEQQVTELEILRVKKSIKDLPNERSTRTKPRLASRDAAIKAA